MHGKPSITAGMYITDCVQVWSGYVLFTHEQDQTGGIPLSQGARDPSTKRGAPRMRWHGACPNTSICGGGSDGDSNG